MKEGPKPSKPEPPAKPEDTGPRTRARRLSHNPGPRPRSGRPHPVEGRNVENTGFVSQKLTARFEEVRAQVLTHPALFAAQGSVVATWRTHRGRRLGPYFQVSYRDGLRQRWIYLGRSDELARKVRGLLAEAQHRQRQRRLLASLQRQVRSSLARSKARLKQDLAEKGIHLKGFEFRCAARALRAPHRSHASLPHRSYASRGNAP
jgi:hypothetical protein